MNVHFVQIDDDNFMTAHPFIQMPKLFNKLGPLFRMGFGQQLFALFPTRVPLGRGLLQNGPQGVATDLALEFTFHSLTQFLQGPTGSGQFMVEWSARLDRIDDFIAFVLVKKGGTPPLG